MLCMLDLGGIEMKPEAINRACAELCGWKQIDGMWHHPDGTPIGFTPPFTTSLDAAQMAFKALTDEQQMQAMFALPDDLGWIFLATPLQWCEAILRAAGKWKE